MIWESWPWKKELLRESAATKRRLKKLLTEGSDESIETATAVVEKFTFTTAFIIRKLRESGKLSDNHQNIRMSVERLSRISLADPIDIMNWHHLDRFYDFEHPDQTHLNPGELCNYLIHSFVFSSLFNDDFTEIVGFYVNSDRTKDKALFCISLDEFYRLIQVTAYDYIVNLSIRRDRANDNAKLHPARREYAQGGYCPDRVTDKMVEWCKANNVKIINPHDIGNKTVIKLGIRSDDQEH